MSYNFDPMTDEEIEASSLVEDGTYNFEVVKSTRKTSKSGNQMAEIQNMIWDKDGKTHMVFDYLVFSKVPMNIKKVKHFCDATGLQEEYKKGQLPEELERLSGKAIIGIQDERPNPNGGVYARKNVVIDYVITDKGAVKSPPSDQFMDDDSIPF